MNRKFVTTAILLCTIAVCSESYAARYVDMNDEIIHDTDTGLMWTKDALLTTISLGEADEYVSNFTLSGYIDWRLPSQGEVQTLLDGLPKWDAVGMFQEINYSTCDRHADGYTDSGVFLANDETGFKYNAGCSKTETVEISGKVNIWLVRSGTQSAKRYTQEEVDTIRDDAYDQGLKDAGDIWPSFSIETSTLTIPALTVPGAFGGKTVYSAKLESVPATSPPLFSLIDVKEITDILPPE